jgi:hypothetical protein
MKLLNSHQKISPDEAVTTCPECGRTCYGPLVPDGVKKVACFDCAIKKTVHKVNVLEGGKTVEY